MSSEREAKIKLTVDSAELQAQFRALGQQLHVANTHANKGLVAAAGGNAAASAVAARATLGSRFRSGLSDFGEGVGLQRAIGTKGNRVTTKGLGEVVGTGVAGAATMGGLVGGIAIGASLVDAGRRAKTLEKQMRQLAFAVKAGSGAVIDQGEALQRVTSVSDKYNIAAEDVAATQRKLFDETGDYDFASKSLDTVATVASGTGKDLGLLSDMAAELNQSFGFTADTVGDAMGSIIALGNKGGMSVEEMTGSLKQLGAAAKLAGMEGEAGFKSMMGLLSVAEGSTGSAGEALKVTRALIGDVQTGSLAQRATKAGVRGVKAGMDVEESLGAIFASTGADQQRLSKIFSNPKELGVVAELAKIYAEAAKNGGPKDAANALAQALQKAGQGGLTFADMQNAAAEALKKDELGAELNKLKNALTPLGKELTSLATIMAKEVSPMLVAAAKETTKGLKDLLSGGDQLLNPDKYNTVVGGKDEFGLDRALGAVARVAEGDEYSADDVKSGKLKYTYTKQLEDGTYREVTEAWKDIDETNRQRIGASMLEQKKVPQREDGSYLDTISGVSYRDEAVEKYKDDRKNAESGQQAYEQLKKLPPLELKSGKGSGFLDWEPGAPRRGGGRGPVAPTQDAGRAMTDRLDRILATAKDDRPVAIKGTVQVEIVNGALPPGSGLPR